MSNENINKYLKILAIIALIIFIAFTLLQICNYFMNLVTVFGITIVLTYVLLEPVNILERALKKYLPPFEIKYPKKVFNTGSIKFTIPEIVFSVEKRVISIITMYILFLLIVLFLAIQLIPPAVSQVTDFAKNIPIYASNLSSKLEISVNYINKKFPDLKIASFFGEENTNINNIDYHSTKAPTLIHDISSDNKISDVYKYDEALNESLESSSKAIHANKIEQIALQTAISFKNEIISFIQNNAQNAINNIISLASGTLTGIGYILTIFVLSFYFLMDGKKLINNINKLLPEHTKTKAIELEKSINDSLLGFLKGQVFLGIMTGLVMLPVYIMFGVNYALFLSIFLAVAEIIPVIGSSIGFIPAIIVILFSQDPIVLVFVWFIFWVIQTIKDNIIAPKIVGEIIGLHPVTVIFALWIGYQVAGFFGILFAIPIASVINVIISFIVAKKTSEVTNES